MATETELAWAAGFFDGEGTIGIYRRTQYRGGVKYVSWHIVSRVTGCHQASIERFGEIIGEGMVKHLCRKTKKLRDVWNWNSSGKRMIEALSRLLPYLVIKKDQIELGIAFRLTVKNYGGAGTPRDVSDKQAAMSAAMKSLKLVS